jgi:beta-lactamase class D
LLKKTPDYILRAKTGWAGLGSKAVAQVGWIVGYLEKGKDGYFFATNIDIRSDKDAPK